MTEIEPKRDIAAAAAEVARLTAEAAALSSDDSSSGVELVASSSLPAEEVKHAIALRRAKLAKTTEKLKVAQNELRSMLEAQMREAHAVLQPLQEQMDRLKDAIWTVSLYLGVEEDIVVLREGEPASPDTPVTVRQLVLAMDEECAVAAEEGGIDAMSIEEFDRWLVEDPAHLQQVLPEPRGVVVLRPRRRAKNYGDPWTQRAMDEANKVSYWLIRNGDRLMRMHTDIDVGDRLVPARDEFMPLFTDRRFNFETREYDEVVLEPGSSAWLKAEKAADGRRRHYMRIALVLQGLVDRTTVFAPLPPGVTFLDSRSYDEGRVAIVNDAERTIGGGETFRTWQRRLNGELRPGMRLVGAFGTEAWRHANMRESQFQHSRLSPRGASAPQANVAHVIDERRSDRALVFRYDRTDEIWDEYEGFRPAKTRASCWVYPDDAFIIPFDLADAPTMRRFLRDRTSRGDYTEMFPLLKAAIRLKDAEAAEEAPFRQLLAGKVAEAHGEVLDPSGDELDDLVTWWKTTNRRHRPLVGDDVAAQTKAVSDIVAEFDGRRAAAERAADEAALESRVVERLRDRYPDVLAVWRHRNGSFVAYVPQHERDEVWVQRVTVSPAGRSEKAEEWQLPSNQNRSRWRVLWASEQWTTWKQHTTAAEVLTGPELDAAVAEAISSRRDADGGVPVAVTYNREERTLRVWCWDEATVDLDWERPLTGRYSTTVGATSRLFEWKRTKDRGVTLTDRGGYGLSHWNPRDPGFDDGRAPWEETGRHSTVLWTDPAVVAQMRSRLGEAATVKAVRSGFAEVVDSIVEVVEAQWCEEAETAAYGKFLADYVDADLWEGHRKTLNLQFPHRHGPNSWTRAPLVVLIEHLVEARLDIEGMTVGEAAAEMARQHPDDDPLDLPEDVAHITLRWRPEKPLASLP